MAQGEFALVREHLEAAGKKPVSALGFLMNETERYFLLADLAVLERDEAALREYVPLAEELAIRDGHRLFQASAQRARGVWQRLEGNYEEAEARLSQALAMFEKLETGWQMGRTLYELGELGRVRAERGQARDYFSRALAVFEAMNAVPDAARTRAAMEALD